MEVILLEKVANLGNFGDKVKIKSGYGRNYLIPQGKAVFATAEKIAEFEKRREELEQKAAANLSAAEARKAALEKIQVSITQKAGEEGKLYGSVGTQDIAQAITEAGVEVHKREVRLPAGALRHTGDYEIQIQLHGEVEATVALSINAE